MKATFFITKKKSMSHPEFFRKDYQSDIFLSQRKKRGHKRTQSEASSTSNFVSSVPLCVFFVKIMSFVNYLKIRDDSCSWVDRGLPRQHKVHQYQKGDCTRCDDDDCFSGDSMLGMHGACP